jgi:hypothetical protein
MLALFLIFQVASLSGSVTSSHNLPLTGLTVQAKPHLSRGAFDAANTGVTLTTGTSFHIKFFKEDIYRISFAAPGHRLLDLYVYADRPEAVSCTITLPVSSLDSGEFFNDSSYVQWIRVIGTFNNFEYETGIPFSATGNPGEIAALIPPHSDTVWYSIKGLSNQGNSVLPGAIAIRNQEGVGFAGAIYTPNRPIRLVYNANVWPDKRTAYQRQREEETLGGGFLAKVLKTEHSGWFQAQAGLMAMQYQYSGFVRYKNTGKHAIERELTPFYATRDSLALLVSAYSSQPALTANQKVLQMRYVLSMLQQLEIELVLGDKTPGGRYFLNHANYALFNKTIAAIPPGSPLWSYTYQARDLAGAAIVTYPELDPLFLAVANHLTNQDAALRFFEETITELHSAGKVALYKNWMRAMENSFPKHPKTITLKNTLKKP